MLCSELQALLGPPIVPTFLWGNAQFRGRILVLERRGSQHLYILWLVITQEESCTALEDIQDLTTTRQWPDMILLLMMLEKTRCSQISRITLKLNKVLSKKKVNHNRLSSVRQNIWNLTTLFRCLFNLRWLETLDLWNEDDKHKWI